MTLCDFLKMPTKEQWDQRLLKDEGDRFIPLTLALPIPLSFTVPAEPLYQAFYIPHPVDCARPTSLFYLPLNRSLQLFAGCERTISSNLLRFGFPSLV